MFNYINGWIDNIYIYIYIYIYINQWISEYLPKPKSLEANFKVELDLSNDATKADLKMQQVLIH